MANLLAAGTASSSNQWRETIRDRRARLAGYAPNDLRGRQHFVDEATGLAGIERESIYITIHIFGRRKYGVTDQRDLDIGSGHGPRRVTLAGSLAGRRPSSAFPRLDRGRADHPMRRFGPPDIEERRVQRVLGLRG